MDFELGTAILAGLVGTGAMTLVMYMGHAMNMRMDIPMTLGTTFLPKGTPAWILGMMPAMHPRMVTAVGPAVSERVTSLGFFASACGIMGPMALIGLHVLYGLVGGVIYAA